MIRAIRPDFTAKGTDNRRTVPKRDRPRLRRQGRHRGDTKEHSSTERIESVLRKINAETRRKSPDKANLFFFTNYYFPEISRSHLWVEFPCMWNRARKTI